MNIENEYLHQRTLFNKESLTLAKAELRETEGGMTEEQSKANANLIRMAKETVSEEKEILQEIMVELYDFIYEGGEVSKRTIQFLIIDLNRFIEFDDEYGVDVAFGKINYLRELIGE